MLNVIVFSGGFSDEEPRRGLSPTHILAVNRGYVTAALISGETDRRVPSG